MFEVHCYDTFPARIGEDRPDSKRVDCFVHRGQLLESLASARWQMTGCLLDLSLCWSFRNSGLSFFETFLSKVS